MTFRQLLSQPFKVIYRHGVVVCMVVVIILVATVYPSDMENDYAVSKGGHERPVVVAFEDYGRHINTAAIRTGFGFERQRGLEAIRYDNGRGHFGVTRSKATAE